MKKLFFDFFPILIFFIFFKIYDIYIATAALMVATAIQIIYEYARYRKVEKMHLITFAAVFIFGSLTLLSHDWLFIMWKVTIINWAFALVFLFSHFFMQKTLVERLMGKNITLPVKIWKRLNLIWSSYFIILGIINLFVGYTFSENAWVNFKLFGLIGLTILFVIGQSFYLYKYIDHSENSKIK